MSNRDPYLELQDDLEKDLKATGFNPATEPPNGEPTISGRLSERSEKDLKDKYDDLLSFYEYLSDQITRCLLRKDAAKARVTFVRAEAVKRVHEAHGKDTADIRKAHLETDPAVVQAVCDHLYFKQMEEALEERRRKVSKTIDRVYRELYSRNAARYQGPTGAGSTGPAVPNTGTSQFSSQNYPFKRTGKKP